jgi:hypothetical protein
MSRRPGEPNEAEIRARMSETLPLRCLQRHPRPIQDVAGADARSGRWGTSSRWRSRPLAGAVPGAKFLGGGTNLVDVMREGI